MAVTVSEVVRVPRETFVYYHNFTLKTARIHRIHCAHYTERINVKFGEASAWSREFDSYSDTYGHALKRVSKENISNCLDCQPNP